MRPSGSLMLKLSQTTIVCELFAITGRFVDLVKVRKAWPHWGRLALCSAGAGRQPRRTREPSTACRHGEPSTPFFDVLDRVARPPRAHLTALDHDRLRIFDQGTRWSIEAQPLGNSAILSG